MNNWIYPTSPYKIKNTYHMVGVLDFIIIINLKLFTTLLQAKMSIESLLYGED